MIMCESLLSMRQRSRARAVAWKCATGHCRKGPEVPKIHNDVCQCNSCGGRCHHSKLGSEVLIGGYVVPEWVTAQTLDKFVPQEQLWVITSRPELVEYALKLLWSKHR